ncbi:MAG: 16S rRNA (adenine(1518)-N(6)/adenine(1519)-N(6))-dimethyltransferase RsmA [Lachnospiraceae bacterium]|nr:16S rRNA (adenine(1518)-N(6)/adenine(1519)-N(6))-dimethyltransferase RsmA [Lachnospiraceae bacterium]
MATLGSSGGTTAVLKKFDIRANKRYGQNFLIDGNILNKIISAAEITKDDTVIEIGPGIGGMTQYLCEAAGEVWAFEIDKKLLPVLDDTLKEYENVHIINQDILKVDITRFLAENHITKPVKVVANLPYYITTPIIMGLLESKAPIDSITIMIQKEVADRMISLPGKKTYGALSLAVQYYTEAEAVAIVPPTCFIPQPKVSSTVMRLKIRKTPVVEVLDEEMLFTLIRASFNQRRKTLLNGLKNYPKLGFGSSEITEAIEKLGKPATVRGEELSLEEFAMLSNIFTEK